MQDFRKRARMAGPGCRPVDIMFAARRSLPGGQIDVENRAAAGSVFETHGAAKPGDDLLDDAQSETAAALVAGVAEIGLGKPFEDAGLELGRNSGAMIPH